MSTGESSRPRQVYYFRYGGAQRGDAHLHGESYSGGDCFALSC
jgi:hypothetical protein